MNENEKVYILLLYLKCKFNFNIKNMDNDRFILSFVDKSINVFGVDGQTHATIKSGFKFSKFEKKFAELGFKNLPDFVVDILNKHGYKRDYNLNMWIIKTQGVAKFNPEDEYNEITGRRIAVMRAKKKAYEKSLDVLCEISRRFYGIVNTCTNTICEVCVFVSDEMDAIDRVIETGKSDLN